MSELAELLRRAEDYARDGDARAAVAFYSSALAEARNQRLSDPQIVERLRQGQSFVQARTRDFLGALERSLDGIEPEDKVARLRLDHALGLLKGERQVYPQAPSAFYYPYLAQRQFFEREEFAWVPQLEAEFPAIREELAALLSEGADFRPYVENEPDRPSRDFHGLNENVSWTALYLWKDGRKVEENAARCPRTVAALEKVPLSHIGQRTPSVLFSRLTPGAHIPPHTGMLNSRLICHLPLIAPPGCWLRVGNETREWREGELMIFDDSIEHEAKNPTGETRIILLFDIWRPELGAAEREGISAIFEAIDVFSAPRDA